MSKNEMLLKLQKQLEIVVKRKNNLEKKMKEIDERPNEYITRNTYKEWHRIYCKVNYLILRIETIKSKLELLGNKDIVRDVISGSKGLFNHIIGAN